ncbi:uncharacterized protein LOC127813378 [Diospyros lotus]|uniref:uncharacterized protein LOC127813378 n=1 Tax=Diospyros lotus TaxID=55363 RepID=UPI00225B3FE6|nr:uncharacterized protein LOC127813378 [Diospyros lotus]
MVGLNSHDSNAKKPLRKPLMLKDYLLDDLSSCSSNGFRSYPRRQCCTTVRFLVDMDLNTTDSSGHGKRFLKSKSKSASTTTMSAFQRASEAAINAVKFLPFASTKSPSSASKQKKTKSSILPRSLSRKLLRRSFWKKTDKDMQQQRSWKSFMYFLEQKYPSDSSPSAALTSATTSTVTTASYSNSSVSETNSNGHSWSESDFTSDSLQSSSGNSESSGENDVVAGEKPARAGKRVGVTVGDDSTEANSKNKWRNEEEKEQFSPVSVLDFPFDDDDEEVSSSSSPFQHRRLANSMEGTRQKKLIRKTARRFERVAQLEAQAVDLEKQFSDESSSLELEEEEEAQQRAVALLELLKSTHLPIPSVVFKFDAENLLLDFFAERMGAEAEAELEKEQEVLNVARDWMRGQAHDDGIMLLEWEVEENREAYVREMERGGRWKKLENEEKEEVAMELEMELFASLLNELLDDDPMESKIQ